MSGQSPSAPRRDPAVGLCAECRNARRHESRRGSIFWQCAAADTHESLLRYPPLPVTDCLAFEAGEPR